MERDEPRNRITREFCKSYVLYVLRSRSRSKIALVARQNLTKETPREWNRINVWMSRRDALRLVLCRRHVISRVERDTHLYPRHRHAEKHQREALALQPVRDFSEAALQNVHRVICGLRGRRCDLKKQRMIFYGTKLTSLCLYPSWPSLSPTWHAASSFGCGCSHGFSLCQRQKITHTKPTYFARRLCFCLFLLTFLWKTLETTLIGLPVFLFCKTRTRALTRGEP